ncbi:hypothetical protein JQU17_22665, partial [Ponticoccus sp. SC2-23]|nr:hypothetical protein [Ponticoccus sp. SC6-9]MBM1227452.1 hypothetical protein [Ponticoccus sp. SC6-15]MBM1231962.1 hypothetical protein [Ponticoccus sp. SC6-38]MBM1240981.1 hypothetical protein [Ponticoccus sp. SC6-49]MBM1245474.1 hypothetical protein [Ponticoccus sp. SC2-64]MBM1254462.1 hypothetical protein [Ponticoccus sp. SC6-33]MBM1258989.1 hypothetical protein [Ponticoccus sp. SC6-60]MBM1263454.1 hypothetical protein [Ponticoccus sp. SC6-31]MBM1267990.1 hypothetical protein [Pontico
MVKYALIQEGGSVIRGNAFSSDVIDASQIAALSLNLSRDEVRDYKVRGGSLEVLLVDGGVIILNDFFDEQGLPRGALYLSAEREIYRVNLSEGQGMLYWSAPIEWSGLNVSAWSASGLSGRCFR